MEPSGSGTAAPAIGRAAPHEHRIDNLTLGRAAVPALLMCCTVFFSLASSGVAELRHVGGVARWILLLAFVAVEIAAIVTVRPRTWAAQVGFDRYHVLWLGFLAIAIGSAAWSISPRSTAERGLAVAILAVACFVSVRRYVRLDGLRVSVLAHALAAGLLITLATSAILGAFAPATGRQITPYAQRWRGVFENPDELAFAALFAVSVCVGLALNSGGRRRTAWFTAAVCATILIALSQTRSSLLLAIVVTCALIAMRSTLRRAALVGACLLALVGVAAGLLLASGNREPIRLYSLGSIGGRTEAWSRALYETGRRPVAGWGFASDPAVLRVFQSPWPPGYRPDTQLVVDAARPGPFVHFHGSFAESSYLSALLDLGILGLGLLLAQLAVPALATIRLVRSRSSAATPLIGILIAGILIAIVETYLWSAGNFAALPLWTCASAVLAAPVRTPDPGLS
jgi:hypothetical protein